MHDALQHVVPGLPRERYGELGLRYRHHYLAQQDALVLFDGTLDMLKALKARNHWVAVATGKSRRGLDDCLHTVQLKGLFDGTRTADETASKPDPRMLHELMREFGAEPERTLMIGDTTHDLQMARNAGTASLAVSFGAHEPAAFAELGALHVAHSTAELARWLHDNA
jgi:phosphoglycolate phosphatase